MNSALEAKSRQNKIRGKILPIQGLKFQIELDKRDQRKTKRVTIHNCKFQNVDHFEVKYHVFLITTYARDLLLCYTICVYFFATITYLEGQERMKGGVLRFS